MLIFGRLLVGWVSKKLSVILAPFLIGTRYTSFGRHFTKVDKLKESFYLPGSVDKQDQPLDAHN
ncbi:hypothetical protein HanXRQr2_Chr04g0168121 [Helianthus annuus]|uniref:Uncharacterized protein n=1 Tax=Helianthus annuus TaxID=4232 RepID=A0A9K3J8E7_HELAN|nr:hypothetical protein HanXRQr2_Chr04g0168121 [Helianthus annuus]KAJ0931451.1 hypothetical protein HanPSC8_Chr04g0161781 [Helianthus annuus]